MSTDVAGEEVRNTVRELRDSLILLGLVVSSISGYLGLAVVAVRLFARP